MNNILPLFNEIKGLVRGLLLVNQNAMRSAQVAANRSGSDAKYSTMIISRER